VGLSRQSRKKLAEQTSCHVLNLRRALRHRQKKKKDGVEMPNKTERQAKQCG